MTFSNTTQDAQPSFTSPEQIGLRKEIGEVEAKLSDARNYAAAIDKETTSLNKRLRSNTIAQFTSRSRIVRTCLKHRSGLSAAAIQKDYNRTLQEMGRDTNSMLKIFCVTAGLFLLYIKPQKANWKVSGFPTLGDTCIPELREWLITKTLEPRERYATEFLEEVEECVVWMLPWVHDKYGDIKMDVQVRTHWESETSSKVAELQQVLS